MNTISMDEKRRRSLPAKFKHEYAEAVNLSNHPNNKRGPQDLSLSSIIMQKRPRGRPPLSSK